MFDSNVPDDKNHLGQLECIANISAMTSTRLRLRLGRRKPILTLRRPSSVLVHRVVISRLLRLGCSIGVPGEGPSREVSNEVIAEDVRVVAESVDSIDGLFGHTEPVDGMARVFDSILQFAEDEVVHVVAHILVKERAFGM